MRLFLFFAFLVICFAKEDDTPSTKSDEILPAVMSIAGGAPDDWSEGDKKAFDQFITNIVKGKLMTIPQELDKLKRQSRKAYNVLVPLADYFNKGYAKLKNPEARKFFVDEMPAVTSDGVGVGSMISIAYNFYKLSNAAQDEIYKAFPEVFE